MFSETAGETKTLLRSSAPVFRITCQPFDNKIAIMDPTLWLALICKRAK